MNNNKSEESIEKQLDWSKAYHVWRTEGCKLIRDLIVPKKSTDDQKRIMKQPNTRG